MADNDESKEGEKKTVVIKESNEDDAQPGERDEGKAAAAAVTSENTARPSRRMSVTPRDGKVKDMKDDRGGCKPTLCSVQSVAKFYLDSVSRLGELIGSISNLGIQKERERRRRKRWRQEGEGTKVRRGLGRR